MAPEAFAYVAGGAGTGRRCARTGTRSSAGGSSRGCCATSPSATRASSCSAARSRRRSCSRRSACSSWRTARPSARSRAPRATTGMPMVFSNQASMPMEEVAPGCSATPALVPALLEHARRAGREPRARAEACGCEAIVVTLDTTMLGWRTRDLDLAYLPFLRGKGIAQYTSDPVFKRLLDGAGATRRSPSRSRTSPPSAADPARCATTRSAS